MLTVNPLRLKALMAASLMEQLSITTAATVIRTRYYEEWKVDLMLRARSI